MKEATMQDYSRLIAKSNNKIKTWYITMKDTGKVHSVEQFPSYLWVMKIKGSSKRGKCL